jgi:uncharacterized membrane protein YdjX (TVP38/TMEM64 family)/rhodanese-related sulfurtransferase
MSRARWLRLVFAAALVAALALAFGNRERISAEALQGWVAQLGAFGPLAYIGIYAAATVLFLPGSVLTIAGGALFGPALGTFVNLTGATAGAALAFLTARYLAGDWVQRRAGGRLGELLKGVEAEGWRFVAFVRLVPIFPFNLLNYALGLTRIPFWQYVAASYVCMLPGAFAYTYLGYAGREALASSEGVARKILLALALLAAAAFLPRLVKRLRQGTAAAAASALSSLDPAELEDRVARSDEGILVLDVRRREEFSGPLGHIAGALNIPVEELDARLAELEPYRARPIAIVCRTDRRSAQAAALLARHGFAQPLVVRGGMSEWNKRGFPVER